MPDAGTSSGVIVGLLPWWTTPGGTPARVSYGGSNQVDTPRPSLESVNAEPVVAAGGPYLIAPGETVTLGGSAEDADGDPLAYSWDLDGDSYFDDATGANPSIAWPDLEALGLVPDPRTLRIRM